MKNDKISTLKNNIFILKMVWNDCPSRIIMTFIMSIMSFASWTFYTVFFMRYLFYSPEGTRNFRDLIIFIWIVVVINLIYYLIDSWYNNIFIPVSNIKIQNSMNKMLFIKAQSVDISCYEMTDFYDSYTRAIAEASDRAMSIMNTCATLFSSLISSVYVIYTMFLITPLSLPFITLPLIGNLYLGKKLSRINYELDKKCIPFKRRQAYVNRVIYLRKYTGEIRLTNVFSILKEIYNISVKGIIDITRTYAKKRFSLDAAMLILQFPLPFQGMWFVSAFLAIQTKSISLADFIVLSSSIVSITWMARSFTDSLVQTFSNANYVENLKHFLNYTPKIDENQKGIIPDKNVVSIEFRNVNFKYPGQNNFALKDINITIKSDTKNALVGINGSGKSTFIKLVMRFYDPTNGEILLNNINIKNYDIHAYRNLIGSALQDFALFSETILENVILKRVCNEEERKNGIQALKNSGIYDKIQTFENKENTILTREFDDNGVELSGGEKQKIAIARAFSKKSPILILDEPSSALDPIAEYTMYESIIKLCDEERSGKISIIVSHRLSSAALCDKIFLFENGLILEEGSHVELLKKQGRYANMFLKQAESYLQSVGG